MIIYHISEIVNECDIANRKIQLYKTVGLSKSYMELDMDKIKDISGDLVDYIEWESFGICETVMKMIWTSLRFR